MPWIGLHCKNDAVNINLKLFISRSFLLCSHIWYHGSGSTIN